MPPELPVILVGALVAASAIGAVGGILVGLAGFGAGLGMWFYGRLDERLFRRMVLGLLLALGVLMLIDVGVFR